MLQPRSDPSVSILDVELKPLLAPGFKGELFFFLYRLSALVVTSPSLSVSSQTVSCGVKDTNVSVKCSTAVSAERDHDDCHLMN